MISIHIGNKLRLWLIQLNCFILINFVIQHKAINSRGLEAIFHHNIHTIMKRNAYPEQYIVSKDAECMKIRTIIHSNMCNKIIETDIVNTIICHSNNKINDNVIFPSTFNMHDTNPIHINNNTLHIHVYINIVSNNAFKHNFIYAKIIIRCHMLINNKINAHYCTRLLNIRHYHYL